MAEPRDGAWSSFVDVPAARRAREAALLVAERLADPARVVDVVTAPGNRGLLDGLPPWRATSLAAGFPATVLLYAELDRQQPDQGWDRIGRAHVSALLEALAHEGAGSPGLLGGVAGMAFAVRCASRDGARYARVLAKLDAAAVDLANGVLDEAEALEHGTTARVYDGISGVAGIARYLLVRGGEPELAATIERALSYLVRLAAPIDVDGDEVPGWFVPAKRQATVDDARSYPNGDLNCGLAHGVAGPLATLAVAELAGVRVAGQSEALRAMAGWLADLNREDAHGPLWPPRVPRELLGHHDGVSREPRASWCYGPPGICRALHLAGRALDDDDLRALGVTGVLGVFRRGAGQRNLEAATVCHGQAGLLQAVLRIAAESGDPALCRFATALTEEVATAFDDDTPFGYRDVERQGEHAVWLDGAGVLGGAAGVALALTSASAWREPAWDRALLLA